MAIKINGQDLLKRFINGQEIVRVYKNGGQIRPETVPPVGGDYLCFTAEESNSSVRLKRNTIGTDLRLEISYDKDTWMDYNIGGVIALSNVGDKVYMRNKSETQTGFSINSNFYFSFTMTGKIGASGDVNYLLCKNSTTSVGGWCFHGLFVGCTSLTRPPELPATTLAKGCYSHMFDGCSSLATAPQLPATEVEPDSYLYMFTGCTSLTTAPQLPATTLHNNCYSRMFTGCTSLTTIPQLPATTLTFECYELMFDGCTSVKISTTQEGEYQTPYRIPSLGTGTGYSYSTLGMFLGTGGTFTGTPSINTTYYTSNQVI